MEASKARRNSSPRELRHNKRKFRKHSIMSATRELMVENLKLENKDMQNNVEVEMNDIVNADAAVMMALYYQDYRKELQESLFKNKVIYAPSGSYNVDLDKISKSSSRMEYVSGSPVGVGPPSPWDRKLVVESKAVIKEDISSKETQEKASAANFGYEYCIVVKDFEKNRSEFDAKESEGEEEKLQGRKNMLYYLLEDLRGQFSFSTVIRPTEEHAKELYILIGASQDNLSEINDKVKPYMQLNWRRAHAKAYELDLELAAHFEETSSVWKNLYAPFEKDYSELYLTHREKFPGGVKEQNTKFREVDRLETIDYVINDSDIVNGITDGGIFRIWPFYQPIDLIEEYLGQKIAFYFEFLRVYTLYLLSPAVIGTGVYTYQQVVGGIDNLVTALYAIYVVLNFSYYQRVTAQNEFSLSIKWGSTKVTESAKIRSEYKGVVQWSSVDGSMTFKLPKSDKTIRNIVGGIAVFFTVAFIYTSLAVGYLAEQNVVDGTFFAGSMFAIVLTIVNTLTRYLGQVLTDFENPKTTKEYEHSLITKLTLFKFMTGFGLLYYEAFVRDQAEGSCGNQSCEEKTALLLRGTFIGMIVINNLLEIGVPIFWRFCRYIWNKLSGGSDDEENVIESQYHSDAYEGTLDDYDEIIGQIGFTTFFVPFFPLAPLLAVVNNIIEVQVDSTKILSVHRRPVPEKASGSGPWNVILDVFYFVMLVTNIASITFRFDTISKMAGVVDSIQGRFLLFFTLLVVIGTLDRLIVRRLVPIPKKSDQEHIDRQEYLWPYLLGMTKNHDDLEFSYEINFESIQKDHGYTANCNENKPRMSVSTSGDDGKNFPDSKKKDFNLVDNVSSEYNSRTLSQLSPRIRGTEENSRYTTFFTGGKSSIQGIYILFVGGEITDIDIVNKPPVNEPDAIFSCFEGCMGSKDLDAHEEKHENKSMSDQHKWHQMRDIIVNKTKNEVCDGVARIIVQDNDVDDTFVTNVLLRFHKDTKDDRSYMSGIQFEFNGYSTTKWYGLSSGGKVVNVVKDISPSSGKKGRAGAIVAVKGIRNSGRIVAIEWMLFVFPKILQILSSHEKDIDVQVVMEGSGEFEMNVIPHLYQAKRGLPEIKEETNA
ncbi:hypothetical protein AAMO2058_001010500 [Amorphochlora amoebiformis]